MRFPISPLFELDYPLLHPHHALQDVSYYASPALKCGRSLRRISRIWEVVEKWYFRWRQRWAQVRIVAKGVLVSSGQLTRPFVSIFFPFERRQNSRAPVVHEPTGVLLFPRMHCH